jgi:hypothetical protein
MIRRTLLLFAAFATAAYPQDLQAAIAQRFGEVKQSMAQNQARLRHYAWTETIEISLKGEVKKREQNSCQYGPDGQVQKTAIGAPPPEESGRPRRLKKKIVEKKVEELKDYMERVSSLVRRYVPPDADTIQGAFSQGNATLTPGAGVIAITDYFKMGDRVTLKFDMATKKLGSFAVATYLDEPKDAVTIDAQFSSLPDGTNFVEQSVLVASAKQIQVKTTNFGYTSLQ